MKKILKAVLLVCAMSSTLHGLINLGEGRVDFTLDLTAAHDSRIRTNADSEGDFVISARPALRYVRPSKIFDFSTTIGLVSTKYMDYGEYDKTNAFFDVDISPRLTRETSRFEFSGNILLNTETRSEEEVGDIITTTNYGGSATLVYRPNRKFSSSGSINYRKEDPDSERYFERTNKSISGMLGMVVSKSATLEGRISYTDITSGTDGLKSDIVAYSTGFSGELLPKVSGSIYAGIQERNHADFPGDSSPFFSANMSWDASERSSVSLTASNSLGTTFSNQASDTFSIRVEGRRSISREITGSVFFGYRDSKYETLGTDSVRSDDGTDVGASIRYQMARWGSIGFTASYTDRSSNRNIFSYDRLRIGVNFQAEW